MILRNADRTIWRMFEEDRKAALHSRAMHHQKEAMSVILSEGRSP